MTEELDTGKTAKQKRISLDSSVSDAPKRKPGKEEQQPEQEIEAGKSDKAKPWGLILQAPPPDSKMIGVDIGTITTVGRSDADAGVVPDLDLAPFDAQKHGVSRRHAILMPTEKGLVLIDLDSTNGTWLNGINLKPGQRYRLRTGDSIEFGTLHLDVRLVGAVPTDQNKEDTKVIRPKPKRDR